MSTSYVNTQNFNSSKSSYYLNNTKKNSIKTEWNNSALYDLTLQPITPTKSFDINPVLSIVNSTVQTSKTELLDQIESIDVTSHEIIIKTSKIGPPDTLKVIILVVDIYDWNEIPPINLTGIFVIITRG